MKKEFWLCGVIAIFSCLTLQAQRSRDAATSVDQKFIAAATSGGLYEVQASQLALQKATNPQVKKVAQHMIDDHTKANAELAKLAGQAAGAKQLNPIHEAMLTKLRSESGPDFDECFLEQQILAHEEAIMCFRKEAMKGENQEVKAFAIKTLPTLKSHLQMVRKNFEFAGDADKTTSGQ